MVQRCQQLDLGFLPPEFIGIGGLGCEQLQGHIAAEVLSLAV